MLLVTSRDEIGVLTSSFNRMVEQLRLKERIRETFGKYIDPQVVEGLIDRPALATSGQRRVMTTLFLRSCWLHPTSVRGLHPQGLVKIMNRYLSTMSEPIRTQHGVIDKYIGDAIMAYWGPPFNDDADQARLACLAALDMVARVAPLSARVVPEILGVRNVPTLGHPHRRRPRRGAGRKHRLGTDDELHDYGQLSKPSLAAGRGQ